MPDRQLNYGVNITTKRTGSENTKRTLGELKALEKEATRVAKAFDAMGGTAGLAQAMKFMAGYAGGASKSLDGVGAAFKGIAHLKPSETVRGIAAAFTGLGEMAVWAAGGVGAVVAAASGVGAPLVVAIGMATSAVASMAEEIGGRIGEALGGIFEFFEKAVGLVVDLAKKAGMAIKRYLVQGLKLAVAGFAALTAAVGYGIKEYSDYEQAVTNAVSVTGLLGDAAEEAKSKLSDFGKELARMSSFDAPDVADAFYALGSAGYTVEQTMAASAGVIAFAEATMSDMNTSAEIVTQTLNAFGLQADQSSRAANVFAAAAGGSPLTLERLSTALPYASTTAAAFNMTLEETAGALMALAKAGIYGSMAGTSLRGILGELTDQSDEGRKILKKYGLTMEMINPLTQGFAGAIENVRKAGMKADDVLKVFGKRAGPAMSILIKQGKSGLDELTGSITGTSRAFDMQKMQLNTIQGQWKLLKSTLSLAFTDIGEAFKTDAPKFLARVNEFVQQLTKGGLGKAIGGAYAKVAERIMGGLGGAEKYGKQAADWLVKLLSPENIDKAIDKVVEFGGKVWAVVKALAQNLPKAMGEVRDLMATIGSWLNEKIPQGIAWLSENITMLGLKAIGIVEQVEGTIRDLAMVFIDLWDGISISTSGIVTYINGVFIPAIRKIRDTILDVAIAAGDFGASLGIPGGARKADAARRAKENFHASDAASDRAREAYGNTKDAMRRFAYDPNWRDKYDNARTSWTQQGNNAQGWIRDNMMPATGPTAPNTGYQPTGGNNASQYIDPQMIRDLINAIIESMKTQLAEHDKKTGWTRAGI